jgi:D-glycero-D-manno-heptose 1,7-bisphosphate phosphatase
MEPGVKAAFLDRDGVINRDVGYIHRREDFLFLPGIFESCAHLQAAQYRLFVVTNQGGIAKGLFTESQMRALHGWMEEQFLQRGIRIEKVYHCPHHPDGIHAELAGPCECRKPKPGMILSAQSEFGVDLRRSVLVGNRESDIEAGIAGGVGTTILVEEDTVAPVTKASLVVRSVAELSGRIAELAAERVES